jgi:hypothetical protein
MVDAEDRELLGRALVWVSALSVATVTVAGILGLAWRVFGLAAG